MAAYERLLRENWFYDANLRNEFFEFLSRTNKLEAELAALPKPEDAAQQKNSAALQQYAEGKAWLADFEGAAPAFVALAGLAPGDDLLETRAISVERSLAPSVSGAFDRATRLAEQRAKAKPADALAATLAGEIYADRELFAKAAPWWNKVATMRPGVEGGYLESATVFWDYYQFPDALRILQNGRTALGNPALYAYEAGAIHENQNDFNAAIAEYLKSALAHKPMMAKPAAGRRKLVMIWRRVVCSFSPSGSRLRRKLSSERRSWRRRSLSIRLPFISVWHCSRINSGGTIFMHC
jgi:hypothetical protein